MLCWCVSVFLSSTSFSLSLCFVGVKYGKINKAMKSPPQHPTPVHKPIRKDDEILEIYPVKNGNMAAPKFAQKNTPVDDI